MSTALFPTLQPRTGTLPEGIDLRCCDVAEVLAVASGARLVVADPSWSYSKGMWSMIGAGGDGLTGAAIADSVGEQYQSIPDSAIVAHLDAAYDCCATDARLAVWYTWPKDAEWTEAGGAGKRWGPRKSGGAWLKTGQVGVGYHWRGQTEPVALFTKGATGRPLECLLNGYASVPDEHSYKPVEWQRAWIRAWTSPGDLVLDLYAGLGSVAVACALEGRRYIGAEIDPERHRRAVLRVQHVLEAK